MIRKITKDEIPILASLGEEFYKASGLSGSFNMAHFTAQWTVLLDAGMGVIFVAFDGETPIGVLAGIKTQDLNSGIWQAGEMAWFVTEKHRGQGIRLLKTFEAWAKEQGCKRIAMAYLCASMPETVKRIYRLLGYKEIEVTYSKEV